MAGACLAGTMMVAAATGSMAQDYPVKPIRIVTAEAGGGSDFVSRIIGQGLNASWGKPVVIDNRGGGVVAGEIVSRAPAKTPRPIIDKLNHEIRRVLNDAQARDRLSNSGVEVVAGSPEEFAAHIRGDVTVLGKMIRAAGIREER